MPKTNVEDQGDGAGAGENTNSSASPSSPSPVAVDAETLSKLVKAAIAEELKPVKGEISGLYSRQDKDRNAFREFMDEYKKQQGKGLSDEEAYAATENALKERKEAVEDKELLRRIADKVLGSPSAQTAGNSESGTDVRVTAELQRYGLDPNDAEAIALSRSIASLSKDQAEARINKFILDKKFAPQKPANPADVVQPPATGNSGGKDAAAMITRLQKLQKEPSKHKAEIAQLQKDLDAMNWGGLT